MRWAVAFRSFVAIGLLVCTLALGSGLASAAPFYDASTLRLIPGSSDAYYYNPGPDSGAGRILFDDVTVPSQGLSSGFFEVTQVSFGLTRRANAPATTVTAYYAPMIDDALQNGGPDDLESDDPAPPTSFGSVMLPANGGATARPTITFGNDMDVLFTVPANFTNEPGFASMFLGLNFSTIGDEQGWTVGVNPHNQDVVFDYGSATDFAEFTYGTDSSGDIIGTQVMVVSGRFVPEPGALTMFAGGVLLILVRRRRGNRDCVGRDGVTA